MIVHEMTPHRFLLIRLDTGQDLLEGIQTAVTDAGIVHGAILCGIGSLSAYHFHVVSTAEIPPEDVFIKGDGPFDILTITGMILDGRVHAHLTFSDEKVAMGGHLEPGSIVLTFAMVTIADTTTPGIELGAWDRIKRS